MLHQIPAGAISEIHKHTAKFIWREKPPNVAFAVLRQQITEGGLEATDIALFSKALQMTWIKRMMNCHNAPWRSLMQARIAKIKLNESDAGKNSEN